MSQVENIVIGGTVHVCNDKLEHHIARTKLWFKKNPEVIEEELMADELFGNLKTYDDLYFYLSQKWSFMCNCKEALRVIHEKIAKKIVEYYESKNGKIIVENKDFPHNYTDTMIKLKNIPGTSDIKGFCPFEPIVRINMLLEHFTDVNFDGILPSDFNVPLPKTKTGSEDLPSQPLTRIELYNILMNPMCQADIKLWEAYYLNLCKALA
jgi:DNA modification methylase